MPLQAGSCTYRIALGPRAGQKVLSLQAASGRGESAFIEASMWTFSPHLSGRRRTEATGAPAAQPLRVASTALVEIGRVHPGDAP
jgi:hypothetical protein